VSLRTVKIQIDDRNLKVLSWVRCVCSRSLAFIVISIGLLACPALWAGGVAELQKQKELTPESFIKQFSDFKFELAADIQEPDRFLERRRGDCDDFARLASQVLSERGYKTKIVVVMMEQESHVVCYVAEAKGFLDFNRRANEKPVVASDGTLEDIAHKVAADFRAKWRMVSEVRYEKATPVFVENVFYYAAAPAPAREPATVAKTPAAPVKSKKATTSVTATILPPSLQPTMPSPKAAATATP
jgi:hypothetical protein